MKYSCLFSFLQDLFIISPTRFINPVAIQDFLLN